MKTTTYSLQVKVRNVTGQPAYWTQHQSWQFHGDHSADHVIAAMARTKVQYPSSTYRLVRTVQESDVLVEWPNTDRTLGESWTPLEDS